MKKINILIVLGLFVLLVGVAQPVYAGINTGLGTIHIVRWNSAVYATIAKFEGLLNAYAWLETPAGMKAIENQISTTVTDLSSSLEELNAALLKKYPTLSEEDQLAVREAYSSLGLYLEDLAVETNVVFGREVFRIGGDTETPGRLWVSSVSAI